MSSYKWNLHHNALSMSHILQICNDIKMFTNLLKKSASSVHVKWMPTYIYYNLKNRLKWKGNNPIQKQQAPLYKKQIMQSLYNLCKRMETAHQQHA